MSEKERNPFVSDETQHCQTCDTCLIQLCVSINVTA